MITWHTRFSWQRTALDLDAQVCGRQVFEAYEIWKALTGTYTNEPAAMRIADSHPVLRMWEGHEYALAVYGMQVGDVYIRKHRQQDMTMFNIFYALMDFRAIYNVSYVAPPWHNDADVCRSHRSNLIRRQPSTFSLETWPRTPLNMPYIWPFIDESQPNGYKLMVSKAERDMLASGERALPAAIRERIHNL